MACVEGHPLGAQKTEYCSDFWWIQCTFSGNRFGTSYTYVIIMIIIFVVLVFLITVIIILSIRFCRSRRSRRSLDNLEMQKSGSQSSRTKENSQKDFYDAQKAQKLEEILNSSSFATPKSGSPLQSSPPSTGSVQKELVKSTSSEVQVSIPIQLYSYPPTVRHPEPVDVTSPEPVSEPESPESPPQTRESEEDIVVPPINYRLTKLIQPEETKPRYSQIREPHEDIFVAMRQQEESEDFKQLDSQFDDIQRALNEL